jgi:hypothetical protein
MSPGSGRSCFSGKDRLSVDNTFESGEGKMKTEARRKVELGLAAVRT